MLASQPGKKLDCYIADYFERLEKNCHKSGVRA